MASSAADRESGFATTAAMAMVLGLAAVAAALMAAAMTQLRGAQTGMARLKAEYALAGAQQQAALAVLKTDKTVPFGWAIAADGAETQVLAEPEAHKLALASADKLDPALLGKLGVADAAALAGRMKAAAGGGVRVRDLDAAPLWRACGPSLVSRYGGSEPSKPAAPTAPSPHGLNWRIGEVWRLRASAGGWADERLVRFTGDPRRPAAVIERTFTRQDRRASPCDGVLGQG